MTGLPLFSSSSSSPSALPRPVRAVRAALGWGFDPIVAAVAIPAVRGHALLYGPRKSGATLPFGYWKRRKIATAIITSIQLPFIAWSSVHAPAASMTLGLGFFAWFATIAWSRTLRGWSVRLPAEVVADLLRVLALVVPVTAAPFLLAGETAWPAAMLQGVTFVALVAQALFFRGKPASWVRILGSPSNLGAAVGTFDQCLDLLGREGCRFAPFRADKPEPEAWSRRICAWLERGETVLVLEPQLREIALRLQPTGDVIFADDCVLFTSMARPAGPWMDVLLGAMNRALALVGALTLWPVGLLLAALIKLEDSGPVFFSQKRVGKDGRLFVVHKFRTMRVEAPKYAQSPRGDEPDPRVTRVGRWMRKLSLDEFPQLVNVFRGEMRLVGPRPEMPFIVASYDERQRQRLKVTPGITGLWQVSPHRNDPIHEHIEYDLAYIAHRGPVLDLALIISTAGLASRSGA